MTQPVFTPRYRRIEQALRELELLRRLAVDRPWQADVHGEHVLSIEAKRHVEQPPEAAKEQPGANQEHDSQSHLGDDECSAKPMRAASKTRHGRAVAQSTAKVRRRLSKRWHHADDQSDDA